MGALTDSFIHDDIFTIWRTHVERIGPSPVPVTLPTGNELVETLRYLGVPNEDISEIVRLAPNPMSDPEAWWYLERIVHSLELFMGAVEQPPRFASLKNINDPIYRFFYVHVFVAATPQVIRYFSERNIPEDIVQQTLADLGRNVRVHRKREGIGGLGVAWWLMLHFRGMIYQLGRLQFERIYTGERVATAASDLGIKAKLEDRALSIHIPDFSGPMTPEACDESIRRAHDFLPTYFPDAPIVIGLCNSWLLDPQLKEYLRPESNIVQFQNRFHLLSRDVSHNVNTSIVQFIFGPALGDVDQLPQRSSLERAVVTHLRSGKNWEARLGWFPWHVTHR